MAQAAVAPLVLGAGPGVHDAGCCGSTYVVCQGHDQASMAQTAVSPLVSGAGPGVHDTGCCSSTCVGGWTRRPWRRLL